MSAIARRHNEWLKLVEYSGPFLILSVLSEVLPQGLDAHDPHIAAELRAAYEEWVDNQFGLNPEPAIHHAWIDYVLQTTLEFPEVFQRGGFSAFIGNPPFVGGRRIRDTFGDEYRELINVCYPNSSGNADFCAFFFLNGFANLSNEGNIGLIATNTIAQGDTYRTGLQAISQQQASIFYAVNDAPWPGVASVLVCIVILRRGDFDGDCYLDGKSVPYISSQLDDLPDVTPKVLYENSGKAFIGAYVNGIGFVISEDEANHLITISEKNRDVVFPYLGGQDVNSSPNQFPKRWVINFFDWNLEKAEKFTEPMKIIRAKVKPHRDKIRRDGYRKYWWQYAEKQKALYSAISENTRVLVMAHVTKYVASVFVPNNWVYNEKTVVFTSNHYAAFVVIQTTFHDVWSWKFSSTLGSTTLNYAPTDFFETFPFPTDMFSLEDIGERYHETRREIMLARQEGLMDTYNRFHDPDEGADDIEELRRLHVEMDIAVASAYSWDDLELGHDFHDTAQGIRFTISESARREVLTRLLKLNHERYAQECADGLHKKADCQKFFTEHPHLKGSGGVVQGTISESKKRKFNIRPFGSDDDDGDDNPKQKKLF